MAILRFKKEPTPVIFREGTRGTETQSSINGEREWQHFVNQHGNQKDTIYLPDEAQSQLIALAPRSHETVLIGVTTLRGQKQWHLDIAEPSDAQEQPPEQTRPIDTRPATARMPAAAGEAFERASQPRQIEAAPGGPHALNYPPQQQPPATTPPPATTKTQRPEAHFMGGALIAGIEAARMAADATGTSFTQSDMRSIGIAIYIEGCQLRAEIAGKKRGDRAA